MKQREIKFRAWGTDMKMHYDVIPYGNTYLAMTRALGPDVGEFEVYDYLALMQYTGLKDKNGKGIYEGDIIEDEVTEQGYVIRFEPNGYSNTAGFHAVGFDRELYDYYGGMPEQECIQVIGNIHENPELIDKTKS